MEHIKHGGVSGAGGFVQPQTHFSVNLSDFQPVHIFQSKEGMGDFYLVERALGRDTVETIVLREKRLEEEQRVQRRKQKRKMDRDAR